MGQSLEYALKEATPDVDAALRWLVAQGFVSCRERGGRTEPFGDVVVEFERGDAVVLVVRDRGQWSIALQVGKVPRFDLDLVHRAMTKNDEFSPRRGFDLPLADQLPEGVSWREELPGALDWLRSTPDAAEQLKVLARKRAKPILG